MRFVDLAVDREPERLRLGGTPQPRCLGLHVGHQVQLKLELVTGRQRVEAALAMDVADRPPVAAWGHTYREEWSPEALAAITVERARRLGWDFVKFQPRASCFAEAFGSVYHPSGHALDRIAAGLLDFSRRSVEAGAAGIFYAISGYAGRNVMREDLYRDLVLPYDLAVLRARPKEAWFNVLHLCGSNLNFGLARDLPSRVVSWSIHNQGNPSLAQGREIAGRAVMGGLSQRATLVYGPPPKIEEEARRAVEETGGRGLLLAPGCSVPPRVRESNLAAMLSGVAA